MRLTENKHDQLFCFFILILLAQLFFLSTNAYAGYTVSPTSTTVGRTVNNNSVLKLEATSFSNSSNFVSFKISKKDGSPFITSGMISLYRNCNSDFTFSTFVTSEMIRSGQDSKTFKLYMPGYVNSRSNDISFCAKFVSGKKNSSGESFWNYVGSLTVSFTPPVDLTFYQPATWKYSVIVTTNNNCTFNNCPVPNSYTTSDTAYVNFIIKNTGSSRARSVEATVFVNGVARKTYAASPLRAGAKSEVFGINIGHLSSGKQKIRIVIDPNDKVKESDENNTLEFSIPVSPASTVRPSVDLTFYQPATWKYSVIVTTNNNCTFNNCPVPNSYTTSDTAYVNFIIKNTGSSRARSVEATVFVNGVARRTYAASSLRAGAKSEVFGINIGHLGSGKQKIRIVIDPNDKVKESDENNTLEFSIPVSPTPTVRPSVDLTFDQPGGWSYAGVLTTNNNCTSSTCVSPSGYTTSDTTYLNFRVKNNGTSRAGRFNVRVKVDKRVIKTWTVSSLDSGGIRDFLRIRVGSLGEGRRHISILIDSQNDIAESDETNNTHAFSIPVSPASTVCPSLNFHVTQKEEGGKLFDFSWEAKGFTPQGYEIFSASSGGFVSLLKEKNISITKKVTRYTKTIFLDPTKTVNKFKIKVWGVDSNGETVTREATTSLVVTIDPSMAPTVTGLLTDLRVAASSGGKITLTGVVTAGAGDNLTKVTAIVTGPGITDSNKTAKSESCLANTTSYDLKAFSFDNTTFKKIGGIYTVAIWAKSTKYPEPKSALGSFSVTVVKIPNLQVVSAREGGDVFVSLESNGNDSKTYDIYLQKESENEPVSVSQLSESCENAEEKKSSECLAKGVSLTKGVVTIHIPPSEPSVYSRYKLSIVDTSEAGKSSVTFVPGEIDAVTCTDRFPRHIAITDLGQEILFKNSATEQGQLGYATCEYLGDYIEPGPGKEVREKELSDGEVEVEVTNVGEALTRYHAGADFKTKDTGATRSGAKPEDECAIKKAGITFDSKNIPSAGTAGGKDYSWVLYSPVAGTVDSIDETTLGRITIKVNDNLRVIFLHLDYIAVKAGGTIKIGTPLGITGKKAPGNMLPHLHMEVHNANKKNGIAIGKLTCPKNTKACVENLTTNPEEVFNLPTITQIKPEKTSVGKKITITGINFDATASSNIVHFAGGAEAQAEAGSTTTSLTVTIPTGAKSGDITVSTNEKGQGNALSTTIQGSHSGGGGKKEGNSFPLTILDSVAPITETSRHTGIYTSAINVKLSCEPGKGGAACSKIYYTTDGSTPTTGSSLYTGEIKVDKNMSLRFFSVDNAGNAEIPKTQEYKIVSGQPVLKVSESSLRFSAQEIKKTIMISNNGSGELYWKASSEPPWIKLSQKGGIVKRGENALEVVVNRTSLPVNNIGKGNIHIEAKDEGGKVIGRADIPVSLYTGSAGVLNVSPSSLHFGDKRTTATLHIANKGNSALHWTLSHNITGLTTDANNGTIAAGGLSAVTLSFSRTGLSAGVVSGNITVSDDTSYRRIPVRAFIPGTGTTFISLSASTANMSADGISTSTVTTKFSGCANKTVSFFSNLGTITATSTSNASGVATALYTAPTTEGIATITAACNGVLGAGSVNLSPVPFSVAQTALATPGIVTVDKSLVTGLSLVKSGNGTPAVTLGNYVGNPSALPTYAVIGKYFDAHLSETEGTDTVTIKRWVKAIDIKGFDTNHLKIHYFNGLEWVAATKTGYTAQANKPYVGYIWAEISSKTSPSITDLSGLPLAGITTQMTIPTLSEWGMIILGVLMTFSIIFRRNTMRKTIGIFLVLIGLAVVIPATSYSVTELQQIALALQKKDVTQVPAIISLLQNSIDGYTRAYAAEALGELGDVSAVSALQSALKDPDKGVRTEAAKSLERLNK